MKSKLVLILAISIIIASCKPKAENQHYAENFELLKVNTRNITLDKSYSASIKGRQDIKIIPRVDGYLTDILVKEGEKVTKGQTLFIIDDIPFKSAYEAAKATVAMCEANLAKSKLAYESKQALFKKKIVSEFDLITEENNYKTAQATLLQAKANETSAANNLSYTQVKSPSEGVLGKLPYREGDYVSPAIREGLTVVSDNTKMYVYFSMNEKNILDLLTKYQNMKEAIKKMPQPVLILSNGQEYQTKGKVESISGVIEESTGAISIRAVFDNAKGYLLSGGTGSIKLSQTYNNVIVIPQEATYEIQNKTFIYKVIDGLATSFEIKVEPINNGKEYIVNSGLELGETIIASGAGLVREGTKVQTK